MRWRRSIFTGMSLKKWMKLPDHEVRFTLRKEHAGRECADGCVPGLKQLRESLEEEQILQLKDLDVCMRGFFIEPHERCKWFSCRYR